MCREDQCSVIYELVREEKFKRAECSVDGVLLEVSPFVFIQADVLG